MKGVGAEHWAKLSPWLDELIDLDAPQRAQRLAQLRSHDATLAAKLEALLAQQSVVQREGFLAGDALGARLDVALAGRELGAYRLVRLLGVGGMGSVWLARRCDGRFDGLAAVKLPNASRLTRSGMERFEREGRLLGRLAHPNIARLLDAGVATSGQPYLVLEYVDGEPIDRWCDARSFGVQDRVRLFLGVLAAVAHAHSNLVLHRDLKPSNILVSGDATVKLLDFGIAKLLAPDSRATPQTQPAGRAFTPEFAAPEQLQAGAVTTATDVYALGVLLYMLLGGEHPTAQTTATLAERLRAVMEADAPRLSDTAAAGGTAAARRRGQTPRQLAHALRGDLDNIVAKALRKDPAQRYPTVAALADDLRRYLVGEPVAARPDSLGYRAGKFVRRHRLGVGAASATLLALLGGVIATTWQAAEARRERDAARFQAERALAKGNLVNLMLGAIGSADRPLTQSEILDRSVRLVEKTFMRDPRIAVDLLLPIAGQYFTLGETERELAVMQRAARAAAATGDPQLIAQVACDTVDTQISRGRVDLARIELQAGLQALQRARGLRDNVALECLRAEADLARAEGDLPRAIDRVDQAMRRAERAGMTRGNIYPRLLSFMNQLHRDRGDLKASHAVLKRLQQINDESGRGDSLDQIVAQREEAIVLMAWGEYASARRIVEALRTRWRSAEGDDPPPPWLEKTRGELLLRFAELPEAERALSKASAQARTHGDEGLALASDYARVQVLIGQARLDEAARALQPFESGAPVARLRYPEATPAAVRATLLLTRGEGAEARRVIEAELLRLDTPSGADARPRAAALRVAARVALAAEDGQRARPLVAAALDAAQGIARDPLRSADVGEALLLQARSQRLLGDVAESAASAQRAAHALAEGLSNDHPLTREALALAGR
jgi:serine/threonine-protein kinase